MALSPFFHHHQARPLFGFDDFFWPSFPRMDDTDLLLPVIPNLVRNDDMILQSSSPGYEIHKADGKYMISVDVPGVKAADISVQVEDEGKILHISGGRHVVKDDGKTTHTMKFSKRFTIGSHMDIDKLSANLADGVLTLTAPVKEKVKIPVQTIAITEGKTDEKKESA
jgi:HSP20 family protein